MAGPHFGLLTYHLWRWGCFHQRKKMVKYHEISIHQRDEKTQKWCSGKRVFHEKTLGVFPGKTTFSLRQLYLRAGYVEARNGWYMKATQIEAKFDAWRGWCTLINECKGMPRGTESHKTYGWLTSESLSISHWHCRIRPFGMAGTFQP